MPQPTDKPSPDHGDNGENGNNRNKDETVSFTLDGQSFTVTDDKQDAGELLRMAGLDLDDYDLTVLRNGDAPAKPYADDQQVHVKDGDVFLSVRRSAPVA